MKANRLLESVESTMDPAATAVWSAASRPAYDERGFGDFYRGSGSGLGGAAAGHLESSGSAPWSAPPVSLAPTTGLEDRQHEDTVRLNFVMHDAHVCVLDDHT